jgi:hypothetical protein
MPSAKMDLARRVLQALMEGQPVSTQEALQLRNWAVHPDDATLPLKEIAEGILSREENQNAAE